MFGCCKKLSLLILENMVPTACLPQSLPIMHGHGGMLMTCKIGPCTCIAVRGDQGLPPALQIICYPVNKWL